LLADDADNADSNKKNICVNLRHLRENEADASTCKTFLSGLIHHFAASSIWLGGRVSAIEWAAG
jgi:hypothetical protein